MMMSQICRHLFSMQRLPQPSIDTLGYHPRRRGAAAIELAITVPLLMLLLIGIIETGRYVRSVVAVANAARNGATYASATLAAASDAPSIRRAVLDEMAGFEVSPTNPVVEPVVIQRDARGYNFVTVLVDYRFAPLVRLPFLPAQWQAVRRVRMRVLSQ
jgi:Flp pilus assembly protein TadG